MEDPARSCMILKDRARSCWIYAVCQAGSFKILKDPGNVDCDSQSKTVESGL